MPADSSYLAYITSRFRLLIWINRQASCASAFGSAINDTPVVIDGQGWPQVSPIFLRLARLISTSLQKGDGSH
jgi:hypothetical protein